MLMRRTRRFSMSRDTLSCLGKQRQKTAAPILTSADSLRVGSSFRRVACRSETGGGPSSPGYTPLRFISGT